MAVMLIVKIGDTFPELAATAGDFEDWTAAGTGLPKTAVAVWNASKDTTPPPLADLSGAVVTGSHAMVSDREAWSEALAGWIRSVVASRMPLLGICYGHQLLAHAMGGCVNDHPGGHEIGTVSVRLTTAARSDPLFGALPPVFPAHATHAQSVLALPEQAVPLAFSAHEPNHAFRLGCCAWGVQFHPEFSPAVMRAYVAAQAGDMETAGRDWRRAYRRVGPTPAACGLLRRFADLALR
jgi:GMP synthase (glutamine-hydrolysing)